MDIKSLILNQLPGGLDKIAESVGVDKDMVSKIMDTGVEEIVKEGSKTEGGLFDNIEEKVISKTIAEKSGLDEGIVSKVITFVLPYVKEHIDGKELMKIIGGLSDGFGMDDVKNIAGAIMNDDEKSSTGSTNSKSGGFLGNILGGLFGKK